MQTNSILRHGPGTGFASAANASLVLNVCLPVYLLTSVTNHQNEDEGQADETGREPECDGGCFEHE